MRHFDVIGATRSATLIAGCFISTCAAADCRRTPQVPDLDNLTQHVVFEGKRGGYFVLTDQCHTISRSEVGDLLKFSIVNRGWGDGSAVNAFVWIKSNRRFTNEPPIKITLTRGEGWSMSGSDGKARAVGRMDNMPHLKSITDWNATHSTSGTPSEFATRLGVDWHAYGDKDLTLPSTEVPGFWKIGETFQAAHDVRTNYLVRFTAIAADTGNSKVSFVVGLQKEVTQVELEMYSNIDPLATTYKLIVQ